MTIRLAAWGFSGFTVLALASIGCGGSISHDDDHGPTPTGDGGSSFVTPPPDAGQTTRPTTGTDSGLVREDTGPSPVTTYPASFPAPPQVVSSGGAVLANPKIVALFFNNDDPTTVTNYTAFYNGIGNTQYWAGLAEYGVNKPTVTAVNLSQAAPATIDDSFSQSDSALQTWLLGVIGTGGVPANDANTEYMINFPATTTVTSDGSSGGGGGCMSFGGYHSSFQDNNGNNVAYGVLPRCPAVQGFSVDDNFTASASHEIIEAATDPYDPGAYLEADAAHIFWDYVNDGSEIGDMCENDPEAYYQFADFPYVVQRFWSNKSAKAGHDPCVPEIPGATFFAAVPEVNDTKIPFPDDYGNNVNAAGTKIAVGATATVNLDLYSDAPTSPWSVQVQDFNTFMGGGSPLLTLSLPTTTGNNGDKLPLTITVNQAGTATANNQGNGEPQDTEIYVIIVSQGQTQHFWLGLVGN